MSDRTPITELRALPIQLVAVAGLFFVGGLISLLGVLASFITGGGQADLGFLGMFIGIGLIRQRRGWRTFALVLIWMSLISLPIAGIVFLFVSGPQDIRIGGHLIGQVPGYVVSAAAWLFFGLTFWEYRVLTGQEVRALFPMVRSDLVGPSGTRPPRIRRVNRKLLSTHRVAG